MNKSGRVSFISLITRLANIKKVKGSCMPDLRISSLSGYHSVKLCLSLKVLEVSQEKRVKFIFLQIILAICSW